MKIIYIGEDQTILEKYHIYDIVDTKFSYYLLKITNSLGIPYGIRKKDCIPLEQWREEKLNKLLNE